MADRLSLWLSVVICLTLAGQAQTWAEADIPDLELSLSTDQASYHPDQAVHLTLTLTNSGETNIVLRFRSSQQVDFVIRRGEEEIWRWSDGRMFAQALTEVKLGPGEQREIQAAWDQKDREGREVPFGDYEAMGWLLARVRFNRTTTSFKIAASAR